MTGDGPTLLSFVTRHVRRLDRTFHDLAGHMSIRPVSAETRRSPRTHHARQGQAVGNVLSFFFILRYYRLALRT